MSEAKISDLSPFTIGIICYKKKNKITFILHKKHYCMHSYELKKWKKKSINSEKWNNKSQLTNDQELKWKFRKI